MAASRATCSGASTAESTCSMWTATEEEVHMPQMLSREELIDLVKAIQMVRDPETGRRLTEQEHCALVVRF